MVGLLTFCFSVLLKNMHGKEANEEGQVSTKRHPPAKEFGERPPTLSKMNELYLKKHKEKGAAKSKSDEEVKVYSLQETHDRLMERLGMQAPVLDEEDDVDLTPEEIERRERNMLNDQFLEQLEKELGTAEYDEELIEKIKDMQRRWDFIKLSEGGKTPARGKRAATTSLHEYTPTHKSSKIEVIVEVHRDPSGRKIKAANFTVVQRKKRPSQSDSGGSGGGTPEKSAAGKPEDGPPKLSPSALVPPEGNHTSPPTLHRADTVQPSRGNDLNNTAGQQRQQPTQQQQQHPNSGGGVNYAPQQQQSTQVTQHTQQQQAPQSSLSGSNSASEQPKNAYGVAGTLLHPQPLVTHKRMETSNNSSSKLQAVVTSRHPALKLSPQQPATAGAVTIQVGSTPQVVPRLAQSLVTTPLTPVTTRARPVVISPPAGAPRPTTITPPSSTTAAHQPHHLLTKAAAPAAATPQPLVLVMQRPNGTVLLQQLPQAATPLTSPTTPTTTGQALGLNNILSAAVQTKTKQKLVATPGSAVQKILSIPATSPPLAHTAVHAQPGIKVKTVTAAGLGLTAAKIPAGKSVLKTAELSRPVHNVSILQNGTLYQTITNNNNNIIPTIQTKNYPKPVHLPGSVDVQGSEAVQVQAVEQLVPRCVVPPPPTAHEYRPTLDDLINAADTVECGQEVDNLTQVTTQVTVDCGTDCCTGSPHVKKNDALQKLIAFLWERQ